MNIATPVRPPAKVRRPRLWLRMAVMLAIVGVIAAGLIGFQLFKSSMMKTIVAQISSQVPVVGTVTATTESWQSQLQAVGSLRAENGADLAAELGGIVDQIYFESGQTVAAGAPLVRLRGNDDEAKLQQLQAQAELSSIIYERDQRQLKIQGVSQATVDSDAANLKVARAQVAAQQALIGEKVIHAPFAGRLGTRQIDRGQYLSPGTAIVTLQALDSMFVDFSLPQQSLGQASVGQKVEIHVDAYPNRVFPGTVTSINSKIDSASRMVEVRATIANSDGALLPGMYVTANAASGAPQQLVTIPGSAVTYNPYGTFVYVLHQDGTDANGKPKLVASQQTVTTGATRGDQVAILKGVNANDTIVTEGQLKLHNGSVVSVNNAVPVTNDSAPAPSGH